MRRRIAGGREGGKRVSYRHRDEMAERRSESTLKVPFDVSTCTFFDMDPAQVSVGQLRNAILNALHLAPMSVRGATKIADRFQGDRIQLDFRRIDIAELWNRFNLPADRSENLRKLSEAIESFLRHHSDSAGRDRVR